MKNEKMKKIRWQDLIETEKESCVFVVEKKNSNYGEAVFIINYSVSVCVNNFTLFLSFLTVVLFLTFSFSFLLN